MIRMLLHIDGSKHCWFQNSPQYDLIVILDAGGKSPKGTGRADDSGVFPASAGAFGTELRDVARRLPQELRIAGIGTLEEANRFLSKHYIDVFNRKFTVAAEQKTSAFRRSSRSDLDWVFTMQTERTVAKDNIVAIGDRVWQIEKSRFRSTLAGCTITIHEHLDGRVSLRYGPYVVGRFDSQGQPLKNVSKEERDGKDCCTCE